MKIERFVLGSLQTNCYLIVNEETRECALFDPATCPEYLQSHIESKNYQLCGIYLTHGHFDHVMGIDCWTAKYDVPVYLCEKEATVLADPKLNLSAMFGSSYAYHNTETLKDGEKIEIAGYEFKVIHTPGHTCGSCCYYCEAEKILMSGDTLFCQSVGRSDFPTGSMGTLVRSIKEKLFCLPEDVMVYPGHNDLTCIADEKRYNPFVG